MLSEYELMNIVSSKRYSRTLPDDSIPDCSYGCIHIVNEEETHERNYLRPNHIRNTFDLFMDGFSSREENLCFMDWNNQTNQWKTHIDVLEDVLTLSSRITSLQLYSTSQQNMRINATPQIYIGILLPACSLSLITQLALWSIGGTAILLSPQLSPSQINKQINKYNLKTLVTTPEVTTSLLEAMRWNPTLMPSLSCFILTSPFISEQTQQTAELFHITLYTANDLLNPSIHITPLQPIPKKKKEKISLSLPLNNTPDENTHRRKLRLIRTERKKSNQRHKASVDDYDKPKHQQRQIEEPVLFPFLAYDPGLLDIAWIAITLTRTNSILTTQLTHFQILMQVDLWSQRILPPSLQQPSDILLLANRSSCNIESLLLELMILHKGGHICYVPNPLLQLEVIQSLQPSILLVDELNCAFIANTIIEGMCLSKPSLQQQLWKTYIQNKDIVLMKNSLPTKKQNKLFQSLLSYYGLQKIQIIINTGSMLSNSIILFLRTILSCSVIQSCISQELGSVLFSTYWNDYQTFGHNGTCLMGCAVRLHSVTSLHLQITDKIHLRGITTEEEIAKEMEDEILLVNHTTFPKKVIEKDKQKVLLCSSCIGRGEIWINTPYLNNKWIQLPLYGLWREDGSLELLQV